MHAPAFTLRLAAPHDAITIAALSIQVFLDTYATEGIRPEIAREAFSEYSADAFALRLGEAGRIFILAESAGGMLGFAEVLLSSTAAPVGQLSGAELVRLYVRPAVQHIGIGRALIERTEQLVLAKHISCIWLTAWDGNHKAHAFYTRLGYADVGATTYTFEGHSYANRVFARRLAGSHCPA